MATVWSNFIVSGSGCTCCATEIACSALECRVRSGTATLYGIAEYTSPSTPPKKYRRQTLSGGGQDCRGFRGANCTLNPTLTDFRELTGNYVYPADGGAPTNTQAELTYSEGFPTDIPCGSQTTLIANNPKGEGVLPQSAFVVAVATNITPTVYSATGDNICGSYVANEKHSGTASKTLTEEDTEADAITRFESATAWGNWIASGGAGCTGTPPSCCLAKWEPRTSGFSFAYQQSEFRSIQSGLTANAAYSMDINIYRSDYAANNYTLYQTMEIVVSANSTGVAVFQANVPNDRGYDTYASCA